MKLNQQEQEQETASQVKIGKVTSKVVPFPTSLSTLISP
jgi:hypothetical protein